MGYVGKGAGVRGVLDGLRMVGHAMCVANVDARRPDGIPPRLGTSHEARRFSIPRLDDGLVIGTRDMK